MIKIDTGNLQFRMRESEKGDEIFDPIRRKWVALTPEEWVRQSLLGWMVQRLGYPAGLIAVERGLQVGGELSRRFDAVVFDRKGKAWMLVECKAPGGSISDGAVDQLLAYQSTIGAQYLVLSNGREIRCWQVEGVGVVELHAFPMVTFA